MLISLSIRIAASNDDDDLSDGEKQQVQAAMSVLFLIFQFAVLTSKFSVKLVCLLSVKRWQRWSKVVARKSLWMCLSRSLARPSPWIQEFAFTITRFQRMSPTQGMYSLFFYNGDASLPIYYDQATHLLTNVRSIRYISLTPSSRTLTEIFPSYCTYLGFLQCIYIYVNASTGCAV
jgi:hypothetical protein